MQYVGIQIWPKQSHFYCTLVYNRNSISKFNYVTTYRQRNFLLEIPKYRFLRNKILSIENVPGSFTKETCHWKFLRARFTHPFLKNKIPRILFFPTFVNQFQADFWQRQTDRRKSSAIRPRVFDDPFTLCLLRTNIAGRTRPVEERNLRKRSRGTRRRKEETILFRIPAGTNHHSPFVSGPFSASYYSLA